MEKTKIKQVIREALAREPAIEWYLKSKKNLRQLCIYINRYYAYTWKSIKMGKTFICTSN